MAKSKQNQMRSRRFCKKWEQKCISKQQLKQQSSRDHKPGQGPQEGPGPEMPPEGGPEQQVGPEGEQVVDSEDYKVK